MTAEVISRSCKGCPVLASSLYVDCEPGELELAAQRRESHVYEAGEEIFAQGQPIKGICCLFSGRVALIQRKTDGSEVTLHVAAAGETLGLPDLMEERLHTRGALALERTELCFTPMDAFRELFASIGPITIRTVQSICKRIHDAEERRSPETRR